MTKPVKAKPPAKRRYSSPVRQEQAAMTRATIIEAAGELFLSEGYGRTSIRAVAERAGVAVDTVYAVFGTKARLLTALVDARLVPPGTANVMDRPEAQAVHDATEQRTQLALFAHDMAAVSTRVRSVYELMRTASAVEPEMARTHAAMEGYRMANMRRVVGWLLARGPLRLDEDTAVATMWTLASPDVGRALCDVQGWSEAEHAAWLEDVLVRALLVDEPAPGPEEGRAGRGWATLSPERKGGGMDILELSAAMIDSGELIEQPMRITNELSEVADGVAVVESFSNVVALRTGDGLVVFDASGKATGAAAVEALRGWSTDPIDTLVYTHGHVDHVGGSGAFAADSDARGHRPARVLGHENVPVRFDRYRLTDQWNLQINRRQFGGIRPREGLGLVVEGEFLPSDVVACTETFRDRQTLAVGGLTFDLRHARGETDDHTWAWIPELRAVATGDFVTWVFPNAGNPQKVQRYPLEWAAALREMVAMEPDLLLPAHALPIAGFERIRTVLFTMAEVLEQLVSEVVDAMNAGATLDEILASVHVAPELLALPYLRPVYDEPEFVVRNVWRSYGGWWDGNPAHLKPARTADLGAELAALSGGADRLAARALEISGSGDHRLACDLVELAVAAEPESVSVHAARAEVYGARRRAETSLMAKGVYGEAAAVSRAKSEP